LYKAQIYDKIIEITSNNTEKSTLNPKKNDFIASDAIFFVILRFE